MLEPSSYKSMSLKYDLTVQVDLKVFASSRAPASPPSPLGVEKEKPGQGQTRSGEAQEISGADALSVAPGEDAV